MGGMNWQDYEVGETVYVEAHTAYYGTLVDAGEYVITDKERNTYTGKWALRVKIRQGVGQWVDHNQVRRITTTDTDVATLLDAEIERREADLTRLKAARDVLRGA